MQKYSFKLLSYYNRFNFALHEARWKENVENGTISLTARCFTLSNIKLNFLLNLKNKLQQYFYT